MLECAADLRPGLTEMPMTVHQLQKAWRTHTIAQAAHLVVNVISQLCAHAQHRAQAACCGFHGGLSATPRSAADLSAQDPQALQSRPLICINAEHAPLLVGAHAGCCDRCDGVCSSCQTRHGVSCQWHAAVQCQRILHGNLSVSCSSQAPAHGASI